MQFDLTHTKNGFQRWGTGYYQFNSWQDFVNGNNPANYAVTYSLLPDYKQAFAKTRVATYSIYGQDEFEVNEKFKLTYGVRVELPFFLKVNEIQTNPLVAQLTFEEGRKIDTGVLPKTPVLVSPRIGFNWDIKGDRSVQLRGGTGIFTGRIPNVWIVAQSGDAGMMQFTQAYPSGKTPGPFSPDPAAYRPANVPAAGTQIPVGISAMDKNLKYPQTWKSSIAIDAKLPGGMVGTFEAIYNKDLRIIRAVNPNLVPPTPLNNGTADNREIFPNNVKDKFINPLNSKNLAVSTGESGAVNAFNPIVMVNQYNQGYYASFTGRLEKNFDNGLSATVAYTKSYAQTLFDGWGDQLANSWSGNLIVNNPNTPQLSYAGYVVPDRLIIGASYRKEFFKTWGVTLSVFYEGSSGGRFSYTYADDLNRDGNKNDLLYVPENSSEITFVDNNSKSIDGKSTLFTKEQQRDAFFAYVNDDPYLKTRKGQYAERNAAMLPWRGQVDVKLAIDLFRNVGQNKHTLQFTCDIFNVGNMLNSHWGTFKIVNTSSLLSIPNVTTFNPTGGEKPTYQLAVYNGQLPSNRFRDNVSVFSTYYMQFGIRYIFN